MRTFSDAVIAGNAPHGSDLSGPGVERFSELHQLRQAGLAQVVNGFQEAVDEFATLRVSAVLFQQQAASPLLETMDIPKHREALEMSLELAPLLGFEVCGRVGALERAGCGA